MLKGLFLVVNMGSLNVNENWVVELGLWKNYFIVNNGSFFLVSDFFVYNLGLGNV